MIHTKDHLRSALEPDLIKALTLAVEFRKKILAQDLHPLAARIAIKVMEKSDEYFAKTKITPQMEILLEEIALDLYEQGTEGWQKQTRGRV